ncbi:hypothetical protein Zmor_026803 [Zophobas morio]|uniref:PSP proline-rich domain-containing protein n=1 Tax=Zophobas morio TaxID=2755281 RepID=A0AA38HVB3_9CUCU|nr:hypothetical protein Zmor_026803 [Zophobas morio]
MVECVNEELQEPNSKQIKIDEAVHNLENSLSNNDSTKHETSKESLTDDLGSIACCLTVKFHDETTADMYKAKFLEFLNTFKEFRIDNESDYFIRVYKDENALDYPEKTIGESDIQPASTKKRKKHSKAKKELFVVDATPSDNSNSVDLRYTTKFTINTETEVEEIVNQSSKGGCFNCGERHPLKDCPLPKDHAKIALARQRFKFQAKSGRYHLDDQRFSHLEPGKISAELRKALGLQKNETPHFVYLMRRLGYPPGWLEEAKFVHSNLDMFDIDGKHVKSCVVKKAGLDESRIVDYPGFNVPLQKGVKDDYRIYRVPPYSDNFSKQAMICFFEKECLRDEDNLETCDINIEREPDRLTIKHKQITEIKASAGRNSPSLVDLEQQKRQLLEELNEEPTDERKDSDSDADKDFLAIKTSCFGTPLLKSSSPYSRLPNPDNFSKDVSPVINFENLPNSTGKYEQLTDVLQKVRTTLKKVQNCST